MKVKEEKDLVALEVARLSELHKVKVHPIVFVVDGDNIVGYLTDPTFHVKKLALDMSMKSLTDAGAIILDSCIIKESSDVRIWGEDAEDKYPEIRLGAIMEAQGLVSYYMNTYKKK